LNRRAAPNGNTVLRADNALIAIQVPVVFLVWHRA